MVRVVTFKLMEDGERYITYWYFPEGKIDNGHGTIVIDKDNNTVEITALAPGDLSREVSADEQNALRDSVNTAHREEGLPELTEDEWPTATESFTSTFFADHAVHAICEAYCKGEIKTDGMSAWY